MRENGFRMVFTMLLVTLSLFANTQIFRNVRRAASDARHDLGVTGGPGGRLDGTERPGTSQGSTKAATKESADIKGTFREMVDAYKKKEAVQVGFLAENTTEFAWFVDWIADEEITCILIYQRREYNFLDGRLKIIGAIRQCK